MNFTNIRQKFILVPCGLLVLLFGFFLRFTNIQQQGIFAYDEAWYLNVAKTYHLLPSFLTMVWNGTDPKVAFDSVYHWGFFPQITYKPSYIVLLMITQGVVGLNNPAAGAYLSAVLGMATIIMIYLTLRLLKANQWLALAGAAITAASGMEVYYSRFGLPYQWPALALLIYAYLYIHFRLKSDRIMGKKIFLFGIGVGFLQTTNDVMIPMILLLSTFELIYFTYNNQWRIASLRSFWPFLVGLATPIIFWDLTSHGLRKIFHRTLHKGYVEPYHQELFSHIFSKHVRRAVTNDEVYAGADFLYFVKSVIYTDGWPILILIAFGLCYLTWTICKNKKPEYLFIGCLSSAILFLLFFYPEKRFRLAAPFYPILILIATLGLKALLIPIQQRMLKITASLILLLTIILSSLQFSYGFTHLKSGYAQLGEFLKSRLKPSETIATPFRFPIYSQYLPEKKIENFHSLEELQEVLLKHNVHYLAFEETRYNRLCSGPIKICMKESSWYIVGQLEDQLAPYLIATYDLDYVRKTPIIWESLHLPFDIVKHIVENASIYDSDKLRLYYIPKPKILAKDLKALP